MNVWQNRPTDISLGYVHNKASDTFEFACAYPIDPRLSFKPGSPPRQVYESDRESAFWRPPPFVDGTPNESVQDVLVRVRQLLSILETQYQGDQVLIVSPDSDNLSVLQVGGSSRPGAALCQASFVIWLCPDSTFGFAFAVRQADCGNCPCNEHSSMGIFQLRHWWIVRA